MNPKDLAKAATSQLSDPNVRRLGEATNGHPWDGIQALGDWIIAERVAVEETTASGIAIPEQAQLAIWQALTVGANVEYVAPGDRVLFVQNATHTLAYEGRTFALLDKKQICARLPMPDPTKIKRIQLVGDMS
jgi:co-chaperonin GroES (HSP10)